MVQGFWSKLKKPIVALAPMADVTDSAFRHVIAKYGKPDVFWTEFVSCAGLCSEKGRPRLLKDLRYGKDEHPIVAQLFGANPEQMEECARLVRSLGFDGLDINMGCPDRAIEKQGAGAALMKNPKLAQKLIAAAKKGAGDMPVSVKTRIGYNENTLSEWLPALLEMEPAAITIHARTRKEMSKVSAHWDALEGAVALAKQYGSARSRTLILGNGDVKSVEEAWEKAKKYGLDGVMIGRGIFGNPWLFNEKKSMKPVSVKEKLRVLIEHAKTFEKHYEGIKRFDVMKKHFKAYVRGFDGAKELRIELMGARDAKGVSAIIKSFKLTK